MLIEKSSRKLKRDGELKRIYRGLKPLLRNTESPYWETYTYTNFLIHRIIYLTSFSQIDNSVDLIKWIETGNIKYYACTRIPIFHTEADSNLPCEWIMQAYVHTKSIILKKRPKFFTTRQRYFGYQFVQYVLNLFKSLTIGNLILKVL